METLDTPANPPRPPTSKINPDQFKINPGLDPRIEAKAFAMCSPSGRDVSLCDFRTGAGGRARCMCRPTGQRPWPPERKRAQGWREPPRPGRAAEYRAAAATHPLQRVMVQYSIAVRPAQRRAKHPHPGPDRRVRPASRGPRRAHGPQHARGRLHGAPGRRLVPHEVPDGGPVSGHRRGSPGVLGGDQSPHQLRNRDPGLRPQSDRTSAACADQLCLACSAACRSP